MNEQLGRFSNAWHCQLRWDRFSACILCAELGRAWSRAGTRPDAWWVWNEHLGGQGTDRLGPSTLHSIALDGTMGVDGYRYR